MGALLVGVEKLARTISRCSIYEALYRHDLRGEDVLLDLEKSLVKVYAVVLQFLAVAMQLLAMGTTMRAVHAVLNLEEVEQFLAECERQEKSLQSDADNCERVHQRLAHAEHTLRLQSLLAALSEPLIRVDAGVEALLDRSDELERCAIQQWASGVPYSSNHVAAKEGRTEGTAEWILQHPVFREWRESSASMLLWLHGIRKFVRARSLQKWGASSTLLAM